MDISDLIGLRINTVDNQSRQGLKIRFTGSIEVSISTPRVRDSSGQDLDVQRLVGGQVTATTFVNDTLQLDVQTRLGNSVSVLTTGDITDSQALTLTKAGGFKRDVFVTNRAKGVGQSSTSLSVNTITRLESRLCFVTAAKPATNLRLVYPGWYLTPIYIQNPNAFALTAGIEQGGSFAQALFAGASSKTLPPSDVLVVSDVVAASASAAEILYARTGAEITVGQRVPTGYERFTALNEQLPQTSSGASQVAATGNMSVSAPYAHAGFGWGPIGIIGTVSSYTPAVVMHGNSIADGTTDTAGDGNGNVGYMSRGLYLAGVGYSKATRGSNRVEFATPTAAPGQFTLLDYATHYIACEPTNDLFQNTAAARSNAQILADMAAAWTAARAKGCKVVQPLILPRTSSTDSWATEANQTPYTRFVVGGDRDIINQAIRDALTAGTIDYIIDTLSIVESASTPGVWKAGSPALTADGVHPTPAVHVLMAVPVQTLATAWKTAA